MIVLMGFAGMGIDMGYLRYMRGTMQAATDSAARAGVAYEAQNRVGASDTAGMTQAAQQDASSIKDPPVTASHYCACSDSSASTCSTMDCPGNRIIGYVNVDAQTALNTFPPYPALPLRASFLRGRRTLDCWHGSCHGLPAQELPYDAQLHPWLP